MESTATHTPNAPGETIIPVIAEHIVRTPGTCSGKPCIAATRIKVEQIVIWHDQVGMSPAAIVSTWPHLKLADVYAALAYYHDHREEIDADIHAGEEDYDCLRSQQPSLLDKIAVKRPDVLTLSSTAALPYIRLGLCQPEDLDRLRADLPNRLASSPIETDLEELCEEFHSRL